MNERRLEILKKIEQGELTVEEGFRQISELEAQAESHPVPHVSQAGFVRQVGAQSASTTDERGKVEVVVDQKNEPLPDFSRWKVLPWVVFSLFMLLTAFSSVWMIQGWVSHPWGWGFWLSWIPFLIGLAGMALMFNSHWLYVRVRQSPGEKPERITISMPLPIGLALWFFNTFGQWLPKEVHGLDIAEVLKEVDQGLTRDQPLVVQVDDEDGEHVEVYIV